MTLGHEHASIAGMKALPNEFSLRLAIKPFLDVLRFGGRSTRTELLSFWALCLAATILLVATAITGLGIDHRTGSPLRVAFTVAFWLPVPALVSRRLQDAGWPGWPGATFVAAYGIVANLGMVIDPSFRFPTAINVIVSLMALGLVVACLWHDAPDANQYGPNPRLDPRPGPLEQT